MKNEKMLSVAVRESKKKNPATFRIVKRVVMTAFLLIASVVLAAAPLFPGAYPFGIALTAAAPTVSTALTAFVGSVVGSSLIPTVGGQYALLLTLTIATRAVLSLYLANDRLSDVFGKSRNNIRGEPKNKMGTMLRFMPNTSEIGEKLHSLGLFKENVRVRMTVSAAAALIGGAWSVVLGGYGYYDLFGAVFSLLITPVVTYLFYAATERSMKASVMCEIGVFCMMSALAYAFHTVPSNKLVDLGAIFGYAAVMLVTAKFGIYRGIAAAVACGIAVSSESVPCYAAVTLMTAALSKFSLPLSLCSSAASASAVGILLGGMNGFLAAFPPVVVSCALSAPLIRLKDELIPDRLFGSEIKSRAGTSEGEAVRASAEEYKKRVTDFSGSLITSAAVMNGIASKLRKVRPDEIHDVVEGTFSRYCGLCKNRDKCADKVSALVSDMTRKISAVGEVGAGDVPAKVATVCYNIGRIIDEINGSIAQKVNGMREGDFLTVAAEDMAAVGELLCRMDKSLAEEFRENRELTAKLKRLLAYNNFHASGVKVIGERRKRVYVGDIELSSTRMGGDDIQRLVSEILGGKFSCPEFSLDGAVLSMRLESEKRVKSVSGTYTIAASSVQAYCDAKNGINNACIKKSCGADCYDDTPSIVINDEPMSPALTEDVSGDTIEVFEAYGRQYMMLSDGMGSGREASVASGMSVKLLREYIEGGADLESALKLVNRILRSAGRECSATIDICEIDLYTSEARFIKSGAAPSFVLRNGSIYRLQSKTVPIGIIRALDAEAIKFDIEPGDTVVMLSDGVARSYDEVPWLLDMMTSDETVLHGDEKLAAMTIVSEAAVRGSRDDITCGIMRVA